MQITVWKNEKESNERLIARFNKKVQASRKLLRIREARYHSRPPKKLAVRAKAVIREKFRALKEKSKFH